METSWDSTGVVMADRTGTIRAWSDGATALLGHEAGDAIGRSLDLIVPPEFREQHWAAFHRAMATGECRLDRAATNLPVLHRDGTVRPYPARFTFLTDGHGRAAGAVAVYGRPTGREEAWTPSGSDLVRLDRTTCG